MDNSLLVGLSAQRILRRRLDITANNLANLNTTAFKSEKLLQREVAESPATEGTRERAISYADDWAVMRDMSSGPLQRTGSPLDVAIDGDGFFVVETEGGDTFYTRDGRLQLDANGIVTLRASPGEHMSVLTDAGAAVAIDLDAGQIVITPEGVISQDGAQIGRLSVVSFADPRALEKVRGGLWVAGDQNPVEVEKPRVLQGFVEDSNVQAIHELTEMIRITRTYEGVARMLSQIGRLRTDAIDALAQVN